MSLMHRAAGSGVACGDFARQFAGITIASMVEAYLLWTAGKRHEEEESRRRMLEAQRQKTLTYRPPLISPQLPTTTELARALKSLRPCRVTSITVAQSKPVAWHLGMFSRRNGRLVGRLRKPLNLSARFIITAADKSPPTALPARKWRRLLCELTNTSRYIQRGGPHSKSACQWRHVPIPP